MGKIKHGHNIVGKRSLTYMSWSQMKTRCAKPRDPEYIGVCVCQRWKDDFQAFLDDMGERTSTKLSIDRANKDESTHHYSCGKCPECQAKGWISHCRWATRSEQMLNRSNAMIATFQGRTQNLILWARELGVPFLALRWRKRAGWSDEEILSTPVIKGKRHNKPTPY